MTKHRARIGPARRSNYSILVGTGGNLNRSALILSLIRGERYGQGKAMNQGIFGPTIILAIALVIAGFLVGGRYTAVAVSGAEVAYAVVVDRFTGSADICSSTCRPIPFKN
jgi:hypothetical protein